jgi:hypothetical protein
VALDNAGVLSPSAPGLTPEQAQLLRERYGPARRHSTTARVAVLLVVVAFLAWVVWAALLTSASALRWRTLGYRDVTDSGAVLTFSVDKRPGETVVCTLQAFDVSGEVVGEKRVEVGGADRTTTVTYPVPTIRRPTSVTVTSCESTS